VKLALGLGGLLAVAAGAPPFFFDPVPRWSEEPQTEDVCRAIETECADLLKDGQIDAEFVYDDLYDADGKLTGVRMVKSTGCKPYDESLLLGERHFRTLFSEEGKPDLDDVHLELATGVPRDGVRIVKRGSTSASIGCQS
jgi:hypothetical protein